MPRVQAEREIPARQDRVFAFLADYADARPRILTPHYAEYRVEQGGRGAGTVISYQLRDRPYFLRVETPAANTLVEHDSVSSLVTTWRVMRAPNERSIVRVVTEWRGSRGIGGVFERAVASRGLRRVYEEVLERLERALTG